MSGFIIVAIVAIVVLAAIAVVAAARRRDTASATGQLSAETVRRDRNRRRDADTPGEPSPPTGREIERLARGDGPAAIEPVDDVQPPIYWTPPDADTLGVNRRQFLNRGMVTMMVVGIAGFAPAVLAFLWPKAGGGFGGKIRVGKIADIEASIDQNNGFYYRPDGRMWVTAYPAESLPKARQVYTDAELAGMEAGLVALSQKCPHLGCRVPECPTSQWFECGCHGSQYNRVGEKKGGPAPRGMDRYAMSVEGDTFVVDTGVVIQGPAIGVNTTGQEAEGAHCVGATTH